MGTHYLGDHFLLRRSLELSRIIIEALAGFTLFMDCVHWKVFIVFMFWAIDPMVRKQAEFVLYIEKLVVYY